MWASCRRKCPASGFTLLEVLVVLVIISMAVAVIGPRLQKTYDAVVSSGEKQEVARQLQRLPLLARERDGLVIAAGADGLNSLLDLPAGWTLSPVRELRIEPSGACRRGQVMARQETQEHAIKLDLEEPDCAISLAP